ncbi:MAG: DUF305 domain-containing protein [Gemmatimonadota bacterium]|nr:DUF305 domain-containing protein [Gemmatimonadota bacterium]
MPRSKCSLMIVTLLVPLLAGCGTGGATQAEDPAPPPPDPSDESAEAPLSDAEIEALYRERVEESRTRFTEADVRFMTDMIHHHAQAVEISRFAPDRGASRQIRTLAARIINAQQDEIETMRRWLEDRDQPVPELHEEGDRVMVRGGAPVDMGEMPGMLSREQIERLKAARGREFDRLFLTFMIEHHEGAVTMVRELFGTDGAGQDEDVFRFASDVQVDQATEVDRMQQMLEAMPPSGGGR